MTKTNGDFTYRDGVSLKEHILTLFHEKDKAIAAALASAKEAVTVAEVNATKWRESANEWRSTMNDKDKTYLTKAEYLVFTENIEKELVSFRAFREERASIPSDVMFLKEKVETLTTFKDQLQGKANQSTVTAAMIISVLSLLFGFIGLAITIVNFMGK